jgi:hypothetical protein
MAIIAFTDMLCAMYPVPLGSGLIPPPSSLGCDGLIDATSNVSRAGLS